jgi:hypothetical protein
MMRLTYEFGELFGNDESQEPISILYGCGIGYPINGARAFLRARSSNPVGVFSTCGLPVHVKYVRFPNCRILHNSIMNPVTLDDLRIPSYELSTI